MITVGARPARMAPQDQVERVAITAENPATFHETARPQRRAEVEEEAVVAKEAATIALVMGTLLVNVLNQENSNKITEEEAIATPRCATIVISQVIYPEIVRTQERNEMAIPTIRIPISRSATIAASLATCLAIARPHVADLVVERVATLVVNLVT